jgi:excisionase family DNA binding protein
MIHLIDGAKRMKYTPKEISKIACVHLNTVRNWIKSGKLPAVKVGGRWFIDRETFCRFMEGDNGN